MPRRDDERTTFDRIVARQPKACPSCGSPEIAPLFEGDAWDCAVCTHVWSAS